MTREMSYQPVIEITRGGIVESIHYGAVVVADPSGNLHAGWGDVEIVTFLRSSAKPFQALPLLESGAADHYQLSLEQIAVICASHSGTDEHVRAVTSIQEKVGFSEEDLMCGVHPPLHRQTALRLQQEGKEPTPNRHNCSGKHTGMLTLASFLGEPLSDYIDPRHPVQVRILQTFAEMCGLEPEQVVVGIDGCSVPTFAVPLKAAATAYARLMDPSALDPGRAEACRGVVTAMTSHPYMVAGPDRFDTRIMEVTAGRVLAKGGAEGYQGMGVRAGVISPDAPALGVAIKIADGDRGGRARSPVALTVLEDLGALTQEERDALQEFGPRETTNYRGLTVGQLRTCLHLQRIT
jgi:L-asparaginase II